METNAIAEIPSTLPTLQKMPIVRPLAPEIVLNIVVVDGA